MRGALVARAYRNTFERQVPKYLQSPHLARRLLRAMLNIIIVNGEEFWPGYLPGFSVVRYGLQQSRWMLSENELRILDARGSTRVDGVLWRLGAVRPHPSHRAALEMIRLSGIPCVNPPRVLLRGYDRLSMLAELREAGLPTLPFSVALGERAIEGLRPEFPCVVKAGNLHGGFGKALVRGPEQWADVCDLLFALDDYACAEPFVDYARDVRCLLVGEDLWAMERRGQGWKVQAGAAQHALVEAPPLLAQHTRRAAAHLGAEVLAVDFLEAHDGKYFALESNDIPGLSGFPGPARQAIADILRQKMLGA